MPFLQLSAQPTPFLGEVFTISGHVYTAIDLPNGDVVVDGTTLHERGAAMSIDGVRVSNGSGGLVVGSRTLAASTLSPDDTAAGDGAPTASGADSIRIGRGRMLGLCCAVVASFSLMLERGSLLLRIDMYTT